MTPLSQPGATGYAASVTREVPARRASVPARFASVIDAHVILRRAGQILLLRRVGDVYASGQLCLPSGHLERGESIRQAAARETFEETGIALDPAVLRHVLSIHQRNPGTSDTRIGFAFTPGLWDGEPVNAEPHKHSELVWADPAALPPRHRRVHRHRDHGRRARSYVHAERLVAADGTPRNLPSRKPAAPGARTGGQVPAGAGYSRQDRRSSRLALRLPCHEGAQVIVPLARGLAHSRAASDCA